MTERELDYFELDKMGLPKRMWWFEAKDLPREKAERWRVDILAWMDSFRHRSTRPDTGMLFFGPDAERFMAVILKGVFRRHVSVQHFSVLDLAFRYEESKSKMDDWCECALLGISRFGEEDPKDYNTRNLLNRIVAYRYDNCLPTIFSTGHDPEKLALTMSDICLRVVDKIDPSLRFRTDV